MDALDSLDTDFVRRQGLSGLGNLLGGNNAASTGSTATSTSGSSNSNPFGGIGSVINSIVNGGSSTIAPTSTDSTVVTSSKSASTTSITPTSTSSTTSTSASTPNSTPTPTPTPTSTPTSSPSASLVVLASTDGTSIVYVTSVATSSTSATSAPQSFLQNKPLEGGVFALVGIVIMIIIFVVVTYTIRRRHRNRLESVTADAITFDPKVAEHYGDEENRLDTFQKYRLSGSSSGHGHGLGYGPQPAYAPPTVPQYGYYGSQGYEQQAPAYPVPSTEGPVYNPDNAVNTGGANLTRKYSNRKPVPPLLPNPVYDPSRSPVLPPHYYMQNQEPPVSPIARPTSPSAPAGDVATLVSPDDLEDDPYTGMLKVVNH